MVNRRYRYDGERVYCRMLGHHVPFSYCREPGNRLFCTRMAVCWGEKIDVPAYLHEFYTPEEIQEVMSPPKTKMASLLEMIQTAEKRTN